jgi:hypothetical protein
MNCFTLPQRIEIFTFLKINFHFTRFICLLQSEINKGTIKFKKKMENQKKNIKSEIQGFEHFELKNAKLEFKIFTFCPNSSID